MKIIIFCVSLLMAMSINTVSVNAAEIPQERTLRFGIGDNFFTLNGEVVIGNDDDRWEQHVFPEEWAVFIDPDFDRTMIPAFMLRRALDAHIVFDCNTLITIFRGVYAEKYEKELWGYGLGGWGTLAISFDYTNPLLPNGMGRLMHHFEMRERLSAGNAPDFPSWHFVPLRYVAYAFGAEVVWDEENQAVYVFDFWE